MTRRSAYANMTASDLARVTRERGLQKPNVKTLSEWADFLEADDSKRRKQGGAVDVPGTVESISAISVPEDTANNLLILVGALAQRANLNVDTPTPENDEHLDLVSRLERRLAAAMPEIELLPMPSADDSTPSHETPVDAANDGDRDEEDADPEADTQPNTPDASVEAHTSKKRPTPPKAKES